jgi:hypothetical protein
MKIACPTNVVLTALCLTLSGWGAVKTAPGTAAQNQQRVILREATLFNDPNDPLEIIELKVKGEAVRFGEQFVGGEEWLKETTLKLKSLHRQPITYMQINIDFPETAATGVVMQHQLLLGRHPEDRSEQAKPLRVMPGEFVEVSLAPEYDRIKKMIELRNPPIAYTTKILIKLRDVAFEDGTIYSGGNFFRRNPDSKGFPKWLRISETEKESRQ